MSEEIQKAVDTLLGEPLFLFSDWPNSEVPDSLGFYVVWEKDELVWVGASGGSLRSHFDRHVKVQSRGNLFCQGVCDRLMFRHMNLDDSIRMIEETQLFADVLATKFVRNHLSYRFVPTKDNSIALAIASAICAGNTTLEKPFLNPK
jgi:hypothetical protein